MNEYKKYILTELKIIEKECMEKGISASEWVERYARVYCKKNGNGDTPHFDTGENNEAKKNPVSPLRSNGLKIKGLNILRKKRLLTRRYSR